MKFPLWLFLPLCALLASCGGMRSFTASERACIRQRPGDGTMRVLKTTERSDSLRLRERAAKLGRKGVHDDDFPLLCRRMLATVNDPSDPGVGIAAPQVGVGRRLVAVQRVDRPGEPFVFYVDPRIVRYGRETAAGQEGCLSVPDRYGAVVRAQRIVVAYRDPETGRRRRETVEGFAAVIFQHEADHLDGVLFIDRIEEKTDKR